MKKAGEIRALKSFPWQLKDLNILPVETIKYSDLT